MQDFNIVLSGVAKRYKYEWIFRGLDFEFQSGQTYALSGPNGSGKSTLMKVLCGHLSPTDGQIVFSKNGSVIDKDEVYHNISYAAPYIDLIEEFSLEESIAFQGQFKPYLAGWDTKSIVALLGMESSKNKQVKFFSSGMKQRLKLVLAILSDTPTLLLDEPTSNLDAQGIKWYRDLVQKYLTNRLVIIASNMAHDFDFCGVYIDILDYKTRA
jgi:ABC-type multidrug transport system ATPase subunit